MFYSWGIFIAMKNKANNSLLSAQLLINNRHFTSSIHCSYYAVLQYMKYMLAHTTNNPIDYEDQNRDGSDTHKFILQEIKNRIPNPHNATSFADGFRDLKKARVNADYMAEDFNDIESLDYKQKADGLITNLKTYFGNI